MKHAMLALGLALLASGCETMSQTAPSAGSASSPALDFGDWRNAAPEATLSLFQSAVAARYAIGSPVSDAAADLRRNDFTCAVNNDASGRGDPPAQICRKTVTAEACTGTWQVHLFDSRGDGRIARARALFDRRCGREGLLGGPS